MTLVPNACLGNRKENKCKIFVFCFYEEDRESVKKRKEKIFFFSLATMTVLRFFE